MNTGLSLDLLFVTVFLSGVVFMNREGEILIGFRDRMEEKEINNFHFS
jgi:hypothetical protein